ncbi:MAG: adenylosuccinate synthase [Phycisphaerales bacterium]|nr:adenylosuccinate synthase [Phycisphaerales bacterium]
MPPNSTPSAPVHKTLAVVGLQWGDEGKGKIVDSLTEEYDAVVRYNGGANAGHSVVINGQRFALHLIPVGVMTPGKLAIIGNGVVVDPEALLREIDGLQSKGVDLSGLVISDRAHVVMPYHQAEDGLREDILKRAAEDEEFGDSSKVSHIGTTRRGIGPCYAEKVQRASAIRIGDLVNPEVLATKVDLACRMKRATLAEAGVTLDPKALVARALELGQRLAPRIRDTTYLLHDLLATGKGLLFEGANGSLLDVDHGTYPFVTGSSCTSAGIAPGTGVPPSAIGRVLGIMKAYSSRVGAGAMPSELNDDTAYRIRERGREYGTTTGRPRRVGWLDLVAVKYAAMLNGTTGIAVTLLDVLSGFDQLNVCIGYDIDGKTTEKFPADGLTLAKATPVLRSLPGFSEDIAGCRSVNELPANARAYLDFVSRFVGVPITMISVGPGREQTIVVKA